MNFSTLLTGLIGGGLLLALVALVRSWRRFGAVMNAPPDSGELPADFGPRLATRRLGYFRLALPALLLGALGFHLYWAFFAAGPFRVDPTYAGLKDRRDQRQRRESESVLRGWIFDREQDVNRTLARYRYLNGRVMRDYPLGPAAAHLVGYGTFVRGDSLLERVVNAPAGEYRQTGLLDGLGAILREPALPLVGPDLVTTIDFDLQREAFSRIRERQAAVVVLNPQNGELLAMASSPGYDPGYVELPERWREMVADERRKPLLNRTISEYYLPGSTLKTLTAAAAIESRLDGRTFVCRGEGWIPPGSGRPIRDDQGEAHGTVDLNEAFTHSCNQYFAQLGVEVERQRMGEAADRFGLRLFTNPRESMRAGRQEGLWNTSQRVLSAVLAPFNSTFVAGRGLSKYDLALESIGQGYVQTTPLQMALVAAAVANRDGMMMRPTIELGRPPVPFSQAMSPATAARLRQLMAQVVRKGTASSALAPILLGEVTAGGKTGTAQRLVTVYDSRTGRPVTFRDERGRERIRRDLRLDSWFIGFAPVENPQIAFAVVVEGGGYGAATSAPIAGHLVRRAFQNGLIR